MRSGSQRFIVYSGLPARAGAGGCLSPASCMVACYLSPVAVAVFCFVKKKTSATLFCLCVSLPRMMANQQPAEIPTLSKKNAARVPKKHAKKRTSAVFCFKFTTKQNARCAFSAALCLCTYVATEECALCFFLPPSQERTSVLNCYSWTVGACGGLWKCAEASDISRYHLKNPSSCNARVQ